MPLGYLLTWTTYGTWLHGDERGSVDDEHNAYGQPFARPDEARRSARYEQLAGEPFALSPEAREIVRHTIREHCGIRKWRLHEVNVRTKHVHAVVWAPEEPGVVLAQFKGCCTRALRRAGLAGQTQTVWTEKGSKKYLWNEESLARAYVCDGQGADI
ncbi:MAG TPA: hypothetical protein VFF69_03760 [Phycisphaerales bacterium]|nr:hypothetical protein [Phycisphaerales bacterium]